MALIKTVRPDTLIATEGTYTDEEVSKLEGSDVGRVVVLPPQATTSTTARLRLVQVAHGEGIREKVDRKLADSDLDDSQRTSSEKY